MQVFVRRGMLVEDPVLILAFYEDEPVIPVETHGPDTTVLNLPRPAIDDSVTPPRLVTNFRALHMEQMVNEEASRRIELAFPDFMQRNTNADINTSTTNYGTNSSSWPIDAQARKAENDRGWAYVSDVRMAADALAPITATIDPTDNTHWPTPIAPVYIEPV